jgi:hypothetical protein
MTLEQLLYKLAEDYNRRSVLVTLDRERVKDGACDDVTLQWELDLLNSTEEYLEKMAKKVNVKLIFDYREQEVYYGGRRRKLTYSTVSIDFSTRNH